MDQMEEMSNKIGTEKKFGWTKILFYGNKSFDREIIRSTKKIVEVVFVGLCRA